MDISALSMDLSQIQLLDQVGAAMLSKVLDAGKQQAASLLESLAPLPEGSGGNIDILA